jgi:hypothetical protein
LPANDATRLRLRRDTGRLQAFRTVVDSDQAEMHGWKYPEIRCNAAPATLMIFHVPMIRERSRADARDDCDHLKRDEIGLNHHRALAL